MNALEILYNTEHFFYNSETQEIIAAQAVKEFAAKTEALYINDEEKIIDIYGKTIHALDEFFHDDSEEIRYLNEEKDRLLIFNIPSETSLLVQLVEEKLRFTITRG